MSWVPTLRHSLYLNGYVPESAHFYVLVVHAASSMLQTMYSKIIGCLQVLISCFLHPWGWRVRNGLFGCADSPNDTYGAVKSFTSSTKTFPALHRRTSHCALQWQIVMPLAEISPPKALGNHRSRERHATYPYPARLLPYQSCVFTTASFTGTTIKSWLEQKSLLTSCTCCKYVNAIVYMSSGTSLNVY